MNWLRGKFMFGSSRFAALSRFAVCLLAALTAFAQLRSSSITGSVLDASGAAIPDAEIIVVNEQTNVSAQVMANTSGIFTVPYLQAGKYTVTVSKNGFNSFRQTGVEVGAAQTITLRPELAPSSVSQVIEVKGEAAVQVTPEVANQVGTPVIDVVPNINHNTLYYASLQPGVVGRAAFSETRSAESFGIGIDARRNFSAISINGGQAFANDIQLDGLSIQGSAWNETSVLPNQDAIQEVRTLVNNFSAEYGRGQGIIIQTTRSGGNQFHGTTFYRGRNEALNANSFGDNARAFERQKFRVHTYGATLGGPIYFPKIGSPGFFNGKDKAFFFVSWEGLQHDRGIRYLKSVPTDRERAGDFSQTYSLVNSVAVPIKIYDPFAVTAVPGVTNQFRRAEIPNARLDQYVRPNGTRGIDPFALKLMSYYPSPNRTPDPDACGGCLNNNNYLRNDVQTFRRNNFNSRIDLRAGKHNPYFTFGLTRGTILTPRSWGPDNPFYSQNSFIGNTNSDNNPYAAIGDTFVISPTVFVDARYGITRINTRNEADTFDNFDYSQFGITPAMQAFNHCPGCPIQFSPEDSNGSALNASNSLHKRENQTNHTFAGSLTKMAGKLTMKFGTEARIYLSNYIDPEASYWLRVNAADTRQTVNATGGGVGSIPANEAGNAYASTLTGAGFLQVAEGRDIRLALAQKYLALYTQNDWRATNKLTINLGLRWDFQPGPTERFNQISAADIDRNNPYNSPGRIAFAGTDGYGRNLWRNRYRDIAPRAGFAYRLRDDFVVRGGYGITYLPSNTGYYDGTFNYGSATFSTFTTDRKFGLQPAGVVAGRYYQTSDILTGTGADPAAPAAYGGGTPRFDYNGFRAGVMQQANLFFEKRIGDSWTASMGWSMAKGDHLTYNGVTLNNDQFIDPGILAGFRNQVASEFVRRNPAGSNPTANLNVTNPASEQVPNPFQPSSGALIPFKGAFGNRTISRAQSLQPYPLLPINVKRSFGFSRYHSATAQINRRFTNGLLVNAHYTWSKALDVSQTDAQSNQGYTDTGNTNLGNQLDLRQNKKLSVNDVPHRLVATYRYELPFGPNRAFNFENPFVNAILGGYTISGTTLWQSGFPMIITGAAGGSLNGRPDRLPGVDPELPKNLQGWYDGQTIVTLPSGRPYRPGAYTYLKYNPDAFAGRVITAPNGATISDLYWYGNAAYTYNDFRTDSRFNMNASVERNFALAENVRLEFAAQVTNLLNNTQFNPNSWNRDLGGTNTRPDLTPGSIAGQGSGNAFGAHGTGAFDPRQIEFHLRIRF